MFGKSRTLALAVATAGLVGMSATMASAASAAGPGGDFGVVNLSHNQVPIQVCNDTIPVNVIGGQIPIQGLVAALGLGNPAGSTVAESDSSCHQNTGQLDNNSRSDHWCKDCDRDMNAVRGDNGPSTVMRQDGPGMPGGLGGPGGDFGVVNLSHNQIPIQVCNDTIPVNALGLQVPLQNVTAGLGLLSPAGNTSAAQDTSCHTNTGQADNNNG